MDKTISIKWTPFAIQSLDDIYDYIFYKEKSSLSPQRLVETIFSKIDQLRFFPESGQIELLLKENGQNSRYLVVFNYKIIYEYFPIDQSIVVTDVFHTSQNPVKVVKD